MGPAAGLPSWSVWTTTTAPRSAGTVSPGTRKATFDKVKTGTEVTVRPVLAVDTNSGGGDILAQTINRSRTEPSCITGWKRYQRNQNSPVQEGERDPAVRGVKIVPLDGNHTGA